MIDTSFGKRSEIVVMYRQMDGYPSGHGNDLASFLDGMVVGNGLSFNDPGKYANGMECLAAQIIAHFKTAPGGFYLYPAGTRDAGEEYIYEVYAGHGQEIHVVVKETYGKEETTIFDGPVSTFKDWVRTQ